MPTITIKNVPEDLFKRLKQLAEANRRSISSEIIACIEQAVFSKPIDPQLLLVKARQLRKMTAHYRISEETFKRAKNAGRL